MNDAAFGSPFLVPGLLAGGFLALLNLEAVRPLRPRKHPWLRRVSTNLCITALAFLVGAFVARPLGIGLARWASIHSFGLLHFVEIPSAVRFMIGFLLMDLTFYYWHRANHVVPILWRFHHVHHIDPDLDVSTSFRFHFIEILYSAGFRLIQVGLTGVSPVTYAAYEAVFAFGTMFHHSNLRIPIRAERLLNKLFVTPRMHGIHHSIVKEETNSNYSVVFRVWDRLHRSLRLHIPQSEIRTGVAAYQEPEDNRLSQLLMQPFRGQREYWRLSNGIHPTRASCEKRGDVGFMVE